VEDIRQEFDLGKLNWGIISQYQALPEARVAEIAMGVGLGLF